MGTSSNGFQNNGFWFMDIDDTVHGLSEEGPARCANALR